MRKCADRINRRLKKLKMLQEIWQKMLDYLLPSTCVLCAVTLNHSISVCAACAADLPWLTKGCAICAVPLRVAGHLICGQCLQQPPPFSIVHALFYYRPPVDKFIMALKFHQQLLYAQLSGELLSMHLARIYRHQKLPELIIPIPLHAHRLRERGFNQALEIARPVAKQLNVPLDFTSCLRIRKTAAQSLLQAEARQDNIKDAFKVAGVLRAKYVAVIDDVITTGHTITEFSKTLRQAGVERIDVWSIARTDMSV